MSRLGITENRMDRLYTYCNMGESFDDSNNKYYLVAIIKWSNRSETARQVDMKYYYIQGNRYDIDEYLTDENCNYILDTYKNNTKIKLSKVFSVTKL